MCVRVLEAIEQQNGVALQTLDFVLFEIGRARVDGLVDVDNHVQHSDAVYVVVHVKIRLLLVVDIFEFDKVKCACVVGVHFVRLKRVRVLTQRQNKLIAFVVDQTIVQFVEDLDAF